MQDAEIAFFGAAGTVTGSRHLLKAGGRRLLLDCGLFQGVKTLRQRNWAPFPVEPGSLDAVVLSHAHLDHSGYLPRLAREGFRGPIYCSPATVDLCEVLLTDSAHLQEADADYLNRHRLTQHKPALPLYTKEDVRTVMRQLRPVDFDTEQPLLDGMTLRLTRAGHILGAGIVEIGWEGRRLVFSGDLGRYDDPLMPPPQAVRQADYLIVESTYGNRAHESSDVQDKLAEIIGRTASRGGTVVIPSFAVGRAQLMLYHLLTLREAGRLPQGIPIYVDSPMASRASGIYERYQDELNLDMPSSRLSQAHAAARYVADVEESKSLDAMPMPKIIISASGMATGGRVVHHLKRYAPDPRSTVLFAGFQAPGTRGAIMVEGSETVKIHGEYVPIRAEVDSLPMLSAHADGNEILRWLGGFEQAPRETFVVHGEPAAADALRLRIKDELGWKCRVPEQGDVVPLD